MNASSSGVVLARTPSAFATAAPTAASVTAASKLAPRQRFSQRAFTTTCWGKAMRQRGQGSVKVGRAWMRSRQGPFGKLDVTRDSNMETRRRAPAMRASHWAGLALIAILFGSVVGFGID